MRRVVTLMVLAAAVVTTACGTRTINQVLADPSRYSNRQVTIRGAVVDSYSLVGRGAYRVDDTTGQLWIVSDQGVPRPGARVRVKGVVREGFNFGTLGGRIGLPAGLASGLVMLETSHKAQ